MEDRARFLLPSGDFAMMADSLKGERCLRSAEGLAPVFRTQFRNARASSVPTRGDKVIAGYRHAPLLSQKSCLEWFGNGLAYQNGAVSAHVLRERMDPTAAQELPRTSLQGFPEAVGPGDLGQQDGPSSHEGAWAKSRGPAGSFGRARGRTRSSGPEGRRDCPSCESVPSPLIS